MKSSTDTQPGILVDKSEAKEIAFDDLEIYSRDYYISNERLKHLKEINVDTVSFYDLLKKYIKLKFYSKGGIGVKSVR